MTAGPVLDAQAFFFCTIRKRLTRKSVSKNAQTVEKLVRID